MVEGQSAVESPRLYVLDGTGATRVQSLGIPGGVWLLRADFVRQGSDLLLTGADG